jgi:hypothetical protein
MRKTFGFFMVVLCTLLLAGHAFGQELLSNEGFETWTAGPGGPPDNWALSGDTLLAATQESGTVRTGSYSVAFSCSTTYTRWLYQTVAVDAESCYTFSCYAYDNDIMGRARLGVRWFDATDTNLVDTYYAADYTSDQAAWQELTTGSRKTPAGAVYAHLEIRMYDVDGDSSWWTAPTIYFDDASFTKTACPTPSDTLTIPEIQYNVTTQGTGDDCYPSPYVGESKIFGGIVTHQGIDAGYANFWIQDSDTAWSGMYVFQNTYAPSPGDSVIITADIHEYYGMTEAQNLSTYEVVSTGNPVPDPIDVTTSDVSGGCNTTGEKYEDMLVKLTNVICTAAPNTRNEWYVTDFSGTDTTQLDDHIADLDPLPAVGDTFLSITGIVFYSYSEFEVDPRSMSDIVWKNPPIPPGPQITGVSWTPTLPADNPVRVMASIFDTAATVVNDSVIYQVGGAGPWVAAAGDSSSSNYHYFTIPEQDPEQEVDFYIYAENDTGGITESPTYTYTTTEDDQTIRINEILYDNVGADAGCFIELHGPPSVSLTGYRVIMVNGYDGTDKKVIDLTGYTIPGDGFFVIAQDNTVPNYDIIDANADFENGPDNVHLRRNGLLVDAVGYGSFDQAEYFMGETWPCYDAGFPYGYSLCRYPDGSDSDYNRRDFGVYGSAYNTPGTANAAPTEYSIYDIQNVPKSDSPHNTERVIVGGIVTLDPVECTYNPGYFIEMSSGGQWSGVLVYDLFYEPTRGDSVQVKGTVTEEFGRTQISYVTDYSNFGPGTMPPPYATSTGNVYSDESLEGVLVMVNQVTVVDSLGYGEYMITDGAITDTCMLDDICGYSTVLAEGDQFDAILGVVDYTFGNFKIQPRDDADFISLGLMATKSAGDIQLDWASLSGATSYVVFRSTDPAIAGDSLDEVTAPTTTYLDAGAAGSTVTNYYYAIEARGDKVVGSGAVGEFDKYLTNVK